MIYPGILGGFSLLIIGVLLGFVVPSLEGIFADRKLNGFTNAVLGFSHLFRDYWWLYIPVVVGALTWGIWKLRSAAGRLWLERTLLKLPLFKTLVCRQLLPVFAGQWGPFYKGD